MKNNTFCVYNHSISVLALNQYGLFTESCRRANWHGP